MKQSVIAIVATIVGSAPTFAQHDPGGDVPETRGIRHEQTVTGISTASTTVSTTTGVAAVADDLYLVAVSSKSYEPVTSVVGLGLVWQPFADQCSGRGQTGVSLWWALGAPTASGPVTAGFDAAPGQAVIAVSRYSGVDPEVPFGALVSANTNGPAGACSGGVDEAEWVIPVSMEGGSLAYAAVGHRNRSHTPGFGFDERAQIVSGLGGDAASVSVADRTVLQPNVVTATGTFDEEVDWAAVVVELLPDRAVFDLVLVTFGAGTVVPDPPGPTYRSGTTVELLAVAEPGWRLESWGGALSGSANPETVVVSADLAVTATFEEVPDRTVTVTTSGLGAVLIGPPGGIYLEGTEVVLVAEPVPGWRFVRWEGDATGSENPYPLVVTADHAITAIFEELPRYDLDVAVTGSGLVDLSPPGGTYPEGTVVTLDVAPSPGWRFEGWSGSVSGSETPVTLAMDGPRSVVAQFVPADVGAVEFRAAGSGGAEFATSVETDGVLEAAAEELYLAAVTTTPPTAVQAVSGLGLAWQLVARQCDAVGASEVSVWSARGLPTSDSRVTAFLEAPARTAVVGVARFAGVDPVSPIGTVVTANGNGVGADCLGGVPDLDWAVDLGATGSSATAFGAISHRTELHSPDPGLVERLERHQGDAPNSASVSLVDGDAESVGSVVAGAFTGPVEWAGIALEIRPHLGPGTGYVLETGTQGFGRIEVDPPGAYFPPGTAVVLTAIPDAGWDFAGWTGDAGGSGNPLAITMDGDRTISGEFVELPLVELVTAAIGAGNVVLDPPGTAYEAGTLVSAEARPLRGWIFDRWEGDVTGTVNPLLLTADEDRDVVAVFRYGGAPTPGLWTSAPELAEAPMTGDAWNAVLTAANESFRPPLIDGDSDDNVRCLAAAIVYARTGDPASRENVVGACDDLVDAGVPPNDTLAWAREIGAYAMAADLVGHRTPELESWFRNVAEVWEATDERTLRAMFHERPNNWGTMAFATLCAVYAYLDDYEAVAALRGWWIQGVRGPNPGWSYGDLSWHADPHDPRQINPAGATRNGVVLDGALPDDLRRGGDFSDPPGHTDYPWGALQGLAAAARVLERYDPWLGIWHVEDRAIHRAARLLQITWDQQYGGWSASGDDAWLLHFLDDTYGTVWASPADLDGWGAGKNAGWAYVLQADPLPTAGPIRIGRDAFRLEQNFPNPFGPGTRIRFHLPHAERTRLTIYDVTGRAVVTLLDGVRTSGTHTVRWNGIDAAGRPVASGVYWCRIEAGPRHDAIKLTLIR